MASDILKKIWRFLWAGGGICILYYSCYLSYDIFKYGTCELNALNLLGLAFWILMSFIYLFGVTRISKPTIIEKLIYYLNIGVVVVSIYTVLSHYDDGIFCQADGNPYN